MKPFLAALPFLLALSPAFAQDTVHPCQSRDQGWKAAFNRVEARYQTLPAALKVGSIPATKLNAGCARYKGAGDFESCGAIVDRLVMKDAGLEPQGKSWVEDGNTITSAEANPIFDRICELRDERAQARNGGVSASTTPEDANRNAAIQREMQSQARTLAMAKKVLAEANASGIGAPAYPAAPTAAPTAEPKAAPMSMVTVQMGSPCANKTGAEQDKCWCDLVQSPECQNHETGACMNAASMCTQMSQ